MSVSEGHCVWASGGDYPQWVDLREVGNNGKRYIALSYPKTVTPHLTPEQARYLAGRLYRMARRLERAHE